MFSVIANAEQLGLRITPDEAREVARFGQMLTLAASEQYTVDHALDPTLGGVTVSQLSAPPQAPENDRRSGCVMSSGATRWDRPSSFIAAIDRAPSGTGTSARMATMYARGTLQIGQPFRHESITGTVFTGKLLETVQLGDVTAVVPEITGRGWITGRATYVLDPSDPFPTGFTVGDIWAL